jgi:hypothetical protein
MPSAENDAPARRHCGEPIRPGEWARIVVGLLIWVLAVVVMALMLIDPSLIVGVAR